MPPQVLAVVVPRPPGKLPLKICVEDQQVLPRSGGVQRSFSGGALGAPRSSGEPRRSPWALHAVATCPAISIPDHAAEWKSGHVDSPSGSSRGHRNIQKPATRVCHNDHRPRGNCTKFFGAVCGPSVWRALHLALTVVCPSVCCSLKYPISKPSGSRRHQRINSGVLLLNSAHDSPRLSPALNWSARGLTGDFAGFFASRGAVKESAPSTGVVD